MCGQIGLAAILAVSELSGTAKIGKHGASPSDAYGEASCKGDFRNAR